MIMIIIMIMITILIYIYICYRNNVDYGESCLYWNAFGVYFLGCFLESIGMPSESPGIYLDVVGVSWSAFGVKISSSAVCGIRLLNPQFGGEVGGVHFPKSSSEVGGVRSLNPQFCGEVGGVRSLNPHQRWVSVP